MSTLSSSNTLTTTALQSLASSATAGWGSAAIDNTSTAYDDAEVQVCLDPANTSPANSKGFYIFVWGADNTGDYPTTGAATGGGTGTEGALTFPDVTTTPNNLRLGQFINYQNADVLQKGCVFSVAQALGLTRLPAYWGVAIVNHSGAALAASLNTVKWRGVTY
jgi:hypothetical protein